jgi:hypothetical protein
MIGSDLGIPIFTKCDCRENPGQRLAVIDIYELTLSIGIVACTAALPVYLKCGVRRSIIGRHSGVDLISIHDYMDGISG